MTSKFSQIDPGARIDEGVEIGPGCVIGPNVRIARGTRLVDHVTIYGNTTIGHDNTFYSYSVIGGDPQDISYDGEQTELIIGDGNRIREFVTVNTGTKKQDRRTVIGSNNLLMSCCHIAHDCVIGDNIIIANGVLLGGHVQVQSNVVFGGLAAVHHFVTIGRYAFIGGMTRVAMDSPPFMLLEGNPAVIRGINAVGLERNGFSGEQIKAIKQAYRLIYRNDEITRSEAIVRLEDEYAGDHHIMELVGFLKRTEEGKGGRYLESIRKNRAATK